MAQIVKDPITIHNLTGIYNRYAPNPITEQLLQTATNGDLNLVNAQFDLSTASTRNRVKNAISPQGAQALVDKHNSKAKPSARWKLTKRNPQRRATLTNPTDINNDGVSDVVISNANNQRVSVNCHTTTNGNNPIDLAYDTKYPTSNDRRGHSLNVFKNELYNGIYDVDNEDISQRGCVAAFPPHVEYLTRYDLDTIHLKQPKRIRSFDRFKKFVVSHYIDGVIQQLTVPASPNLQYYLKDVLLYGIYWF